MTETLTDFAYRLPQPEALWELSNEVAKEDPDFRSFLTPLMPSTPNFSMFKIEDGAGAEGTIVIRKTNDGVIDAALMVAYDHESELAPNISDTAGAARQPALRGLPTEFSPALVSNSPLFWKYDGFPATFLHIFATAAVWYIDGKWQFADHLTTSKDFEGTPITDERVIRQFKSVFSEFNF